MAHLTGDRDRGQIILIAGFVLAVALVALALVMNAAIYTENLATRSESVDTSDAHAYQRATETAAREAFHYAHEVNGGTYAELDANVTDAMEDYDNQTARQAARDGRIVNVSADTTEGTNITGGDGGTFTDNTSDPDWTLATDVSQVRQFTVRVDSAGSLANKTEDEFRILADGSPETWELNLTYNDSATPETVTLGVNTSSGYDTCTTTAGSSDEFTVNLSAGTAFGEECDALNLSDTPDTYDLTFENADQIEGDYSLIVDTDVDPDTDPDINSDSYGNEPRASDHLYSMTVDIVYETDELVYEGDVRIAPGERDE